MKVLPLVLFFALNDCSHYGNVSFRVSLRTNEQMNVKSSHGGTSSRWWSALECLVHIYISLVTQTRANCVLLKSGYFRFSLFPVSIFAAQERVRCRCWRLASRRRADRQTPFRRASVPTLPGNCAGKSGVNSPACIVPFWNAVVLQFAFSPRVTHI